MSSNLQGRKRGKSVSFRGQSNDSNFYDNRPRNDAPINDNRQRNSYRDQSNFNGYNLDESESRIVKLLPDANLTISVNNDFRGSNRGRSRGSRGILKSWSFRDDTEVHNRSYEYYNRGPDYNEDYNMSSRRGFETISFQSGNNRGRGRGRGFHNRQQNVSRHSDSDYTDGDRERESEREKFRDREHGQGNEVSRGRSKSASDRTRRSRGSFRGRFRGRGTSTYRSNTASSEARNSGDANRDGEPNQQEKEEYDSNVADPSQSSAEPLEQPPAVTTIPDTDCNQSRDEHEVDTENQSATSALAVSSIATVSSDQLPPLPLVPTGADCPNESALDTSVSGTQELSLPVDNETCQVSTELEGPDDSEQQQCQGDAALPSGQSS